MTVHNSDIAAIFREIADLLEIEAANPFRIRAYRNAARMLDGSSLDVAGLIRQGRDLPHIPGIGADLEGKMREIVATGRCQTLQKLRREVPPGLADLLVLPGLGPKRVKLLYDELDVHTPAQLERAARDGRIRGLPGFGIKTEQRLLQALVKRSETGRRFKLSTAAEYAGPLVEYLRATPGVMRVEIAGSYRRARETVGDLDVLVTAKAGAKVIARFTAYDEVAQTVASGTTRATVILRCGLQVDLRVLPEASYGAAMVYFTGSKAHNIAIRRLAQARGLKISEYGVFRGDRIVAGDTEESVYRCLDLAWIPPELREDRGEIDAARAGWLPRLVEFDDLRGDLHCHTRASDGQETIAGMAAAAQALGLDYIAITEHSRKVTIAHGLDARRLLRQIDEIDRFNEGRSGITVLKGIEVDILDDGRLDLPDGVLGRLDLVIGAVHSSFGLSRETQTTRIMKAMDHPHFTILAHPTGRLIPDREPYDVDMARLIRHAKERGCHLELNAHPERLDLLDIYCRQAKDEGVLVAVGSDAHRAADFANLRHGVGQARRGWLEKADILNTRPLKALRPLLRQTM
ncbi:DNA polymerase/3'-5' exonuclease PolX [Ferrovibrio sp.]|uniref:DNA polymerase/3'-5' exonuclease PolX n=1 Tax=Ferrovibrio sp. TaxID=1917215 RepID=UPI00260F51B2|nr:DNA polymerase/3'-5' exonuclease PolX [Ferrovibrio sp.]